ncbi:MAG: hypothetical protein GWP08_00740 [Nitrospiraceae bacterium]|nr:hypothetical protein [Nitrospiraceae bacterium]
MNARRILLILLSVGGVCALPGDACDSGTVRDAAFLAKRDIHRLCVIVNEGDDEGVALEQRLEKWLEGPAKDLNASLVKVKANAPNVPWADFGLPGPPPSVPVVAMMGEFPSSPRPFLIDYWEPGPSDADLANVLDSPVRQALKQAILDYWAVVLFSPSEGNDAAMTQAMLDAVTERWAKQQPPGVTVVRFDRSAPEERMLTKFIGIRPDTGDWAGVVFGRGKLMAPPLRGEDVTEDNLNNLIERLAVPCTCLQESTTYGLDIPMTWEESLDSKVVALLPPGGYTEMTVGERVAALETQLEAEIADEDQRILAVALIPLILVGLGAAVAVGIALWRIKLKSSRSSEAG